MTCYGGGNFGLEVTHGGGGQYQAGDRLHMSFHDCRTASGTLQGDYSFVIDDSGQLNAGSAQGLVLDVQVSGLRVAQGGLAVGVDGGYRESYTQTTDAISGVIVGDRLVTEYPERNLTRLMSNYRLTYVDATDGSFRNSFSYDLAGTAIGGSVQVSSTAPFVFGPGEAFAHTGSMLITGANGTSVRVTAVDATQAFVEYNLDGQPGFEQSATLPWSQLQ